MYSPFTAGKTVMLSNALSGYTMSMISNITSL